VAAFEAVPRAEDDLPGLVRWAIRIALVFAGVYRLGHLQDDLVSDALYALHGALRSYDATKGRLKPFLRIRIVGELCDSVKDARQRAAWEVALEDLPEGLPDGSDGEPAALAAAAGVEGFVLGCVAVDLRAGPEAHYLRQEVFAGLRSEIAKLPDEAQRQLDLRYWQHLTWVDLAAVMGIPDRTARDHDHKIRAALRAALLAHEGARTAPSRPRTRR
jgi:RNA polymerase sigma factor (sigma-70 family)